MKKHHLIILFALFSWQCIARKMTGYYVTVKGDTIRGSFAVEWNGIHQLPHRYMLQFRPKFFDTSGNKQILTSEMAQSFTIHYPSGKSDTFVYLTWNEDGDMFSQFARQIDTSGELKLYERYKMSGNMQDMAFFLIGKDKKFNTMGWLEGSFRRIMNELISDYEALWKRVEQKELKMKDTEEIVRMYNEFKIS